MSVYNRDRFEDSRTSVSSSRRDGGYTTVKRYVVKDDDVRSGVGRDRRPFHPDRAGERVEETRIIRREREVDEPVREVRREEPRYASSELVIRKEDDRRDPYYRREPERESTDRELVIRRTTESSEPRRDDFAVSRYDDQRDYRVSERRFRDDYEVASPNRGNFDDRDLQRYTRHTDFFAPAPQPQTIIIKQEPIIIRERAREDEYQMVRRQDVEEERSIVRRDPSPQKEEEFYYEKKVRERIDEEPRRRRERSEDSWHERRSMKREVSPHDSVSQVGHRQRRGSYSSDDSMVYVRRTKETYDDEDGSEPHNKRNLAAGVVAGIGAAELLRNHKKKEGREVSGGVGRLGRDVGAGALGAIAAEGIQRARSQYRSRSRRRKSRGRSDSRSRSRSRRRSRSRSESHSKLKKLGALGLGAAALAAAAAIAQKKMNNKKEVSPDGGRGRSSSRGRQGQIESVEQLANDPTADDARNPKHRNIRMAEAGAAGAAITALIDRARSKSRGGRDRSRSKVRQAIPVVAAGLGSAALAGLYEKNKAKKEAEVINKDERREARRAKSRSRSRQRSEYYDGPSQAAFSDPHLIEYGDGPMHGNNFGADYYGRPAPQEPYYAQQTAVVPAAAGAAGYGAARDARNRSISRDRRSRSRSASSSPGGHKRRRSRDPAEAATAAGIGAVAASEYERKKRDKRERKARKRAEQADPYEDTYNPQYTQPQADPYYQPQQQPNYYPQSSQFPPPPGSGPQAYAATPAPVGAAGAAGYPQDFPPPPPPPPAGAPPGPGYDAYASGANPYAPRRDENVSVPPPLPNPNVPNGLNASRSINSTPFPSINVHPPSLFTPPPYPPQPFSPTDTNTNASASYIPPSDRLPSPNRQRERATSQPPPMSTSSGPRKSVAFAEKPEFNTGVPGVPESESSSPEKTRRRERTNRGYEAGDDTDSTPDDQRRRQRAENSRSVNLDPALAEPVEREAGSARRRHRRRRSADPSSTSRGDPSSSSRQPDAINTNSSGKKIAKENRPTSPADSDATVDLPARFDDKGRKKTEAGDDPVADRIDEMLKGKGVGGRLFGNFVEGVFGPEGRKRDKK